jgi:hypothetical protein
LKLINYQYRLQNHYQVVISNPVCHGERSRTMTG